MMKRWFVGLGALALVSSVSFASPPVLAQIQEITESIIETIRQPEVKLTLSAQKQVTEVNEVGETKISWQVLEGQVTVMPGDMVRYTLDGSNSGDVAAENLAITQPIPPQMTYVLASATAPEGTVLTYSIDEGQTFVGEPMIEVTLPDGTVELQPAPAEAYSYIRWQFDQSLDSATAVNVSYDAQVK
ncbi:MAG: DUF11 domain-containing protein [Leptolyngbyaceae cyanobacterium SM1_1_3]|nr:DUF11 domain-containing protein [Leptolyngbyaceae cyanobacterium SM1_1_3]NJM84793.1 DUF11 domain-containing protein [Leptolyngbyaceae cyanobacterium RM2_2_21]NJN04176.1 DUF11 domain-containing protein [Leptolyngbyaceae cyanobacterium RM1_1_2]NJO08615.1 DUF11 domain-containing protein [Leptolyngbyaceae cyanobacterium SL_1_1]